MCRSVLAMVVSEIAKIDRLGHKIERAAIHRGADVGHVAIGRHDDGRDLVLALLQLLQQRQPVHPRHIDVADDEVDVVIGLERRQRFDAIVGEQETRMRRPGSGGGTSAE